MSGIMDRLRAADKALRQPRQVAAPKETSADEQRRDDLEADESTTDTTVGADDATPAEQPRAGATPNVRTAVWRRRLKNRLCFRIFHLVVFCLFVVWVFLLPLWSWLLNDVLGQARRLCSTPASEMTCGGGVNYTETARRLGRVDRYGHLVGCGCGEGILGDWACPAPDGRFSVSFYISTSPGTGMMAALTSFPILAQYLYGVGSAERLCAHCSKPTSPDSVAYKVVWYAQLVFNIFFGLFLVNTLCVQPLVHTVVVCIFLAAMIVHFLTISIFVGVGSKPGKFILIVGITGFLCTIGGRAVPPGADWFSQHAFYLGECIGLTCVFSIAPVLSFL